MVKWNLTRSTYLAATGEAKIEMLQMWHHIDTKTVATGLEYGHIFLEAFEFHDLYVIADAITISFTYGVLSGCSM